MYAYSILEHEIFRLVSFKLTCITSVRSDTRDREHFHEVTFYSFDKNILSIQLRKILKLYTLAYKPVRTMEIV